MSSLDPQAWHDPASSDQTGRRGSPPPRPSGPVDGYSDVGPDGDHDTRPRHQARHGRSEPEGQRGHRYGDGVSPYPLYRDDTRKIEPFSEPAYLSRDGDPLPELAEAELAEAELAEAELAEAELAEAELAEVTEAEPEQAAKRRAGRDLPAAIAVGLAMAGVAIVSLLFWKPAFLVVTALAVATATWEMVRAVHASGARPPLPALLAGGPAMVGLAWYGGAEGLTLALVGTALAAMVWRLADGPQGYHRDVGAALLVAVYVPFLASFGVLLLKAPHDGHLRVLVTLAGVALSDTGGYVFGVIFGRHPMAPSVSPKKSWEGLAGSLLATGVGCALLLQQVLHLAWWYGAIFGLAVSAASVLGDLAESLLKRDLGVKDMSSLLPGHGGLMDRLDSILFAVPTAYAVLTLVVPAR